MYARWCANVNAVGSVCANAIVWLHSQCECTTAIVRMRIRWALNNRQSHSHTRWLCHTAHEHPDTLLTLSSTYVTVGQVGASSRSSTFYLLEAVRHKTVHPCSPSSPAFHRSTTAGQK